MVSTSTGTPSRLRAEMGTSRIRRSTQTAIFTIVDGLTRLSEPFSVTRP